MFFILVSNSCFKCYTILVCFTCVEKKWWNQRNGGIKLKVGPKHLLAAPLSMSRTRKTWNITAEAISF